MKYVFVTAFAGLFATGTAWCAPTTLNLAASLDPTKAVLTGGGQADILIIGDSLTARTNTYFLPFQKLMQNYYGNAGQGYQPFGSAIEGTATFTAGWFSGNVSYNPPNNDIAPHWALDGNWQSAQSEGYGFNMPYSPQSTLQFAMQPGGGSFYLYRQDPGGEVALGSFSTNASQIGVGTFVYNAPSASNTTYYIHAFGNGTVTFLGTQNTNSNPGVRVSRAANGGWSTGNFLQRNATFDGQLSLMNPNLVMIMLGQNDQNQMTASQFATNLDQLINRVDSDVPNSKIVLIGSYDSGSSQLTALVNAEAGEAADRGVGFINLHDVAGSYQSFINNGYLDPTDNTHFSAAGGQYIAKLLFDAFITDGQDARWSGTTRTPGDPDPSDPGTVGDTFIPEPASGLILLAGGLFLTGRRRQQAE